MSIIAQKLIASAGIILFLAFISSFFATDAFAQRTCCLTNDGPCRTCDTSGKYWKTNNGEALTTNCVSGYGCQATNGDWICNSGYNVGNACGGSNPPSGPLSCSVVPNLKSVSLTPGATKALVTKTGWSPGHSFFVDGTRISFASVDKNVTTIAPTSGRMVYSGDFNNTLTGVGVGNTVVNISGSIDTTGYDLNLGKATCSNTVSVSVLEPKQCYPGGKCEIVGGVAPAKGAKVACQMPVVPADQLLGYTARYDMQCDLVRGTTTTPGAVKFLNRTSNIFPQFTIGYASSTYKCSFRYCLSNTTSTLCSAWGKAI